MKMGLYYNARTEKMVRVSKNPRYLYRLCSSWNFRYWVRTGTETGMFIKNIKTFLEDSGFAFICKY